MEDFKEFSCWFSKLKLHKGALCVPTFSNVKESWVLSSPAYLLLMGLWVWLTTGMHFVLRTIRCQYSNPFWTPDPDYVTLMSWRSDGGCCHSRARADSPTHSRLTGIGLWGIDSVHIRISRNNLRLYKIIRPFMRDCLSPAPILGNAIRCHKTCALSFIYRGIDVNFIDFRTTFKQIAFCLLEYEI